MKESRQIKQLETKIDKIQNTLNNWKQEIMNYERTLQEIIKQVAELKSNSKNTK